MPLYLGLDCGTQSLNAIVLETDGAVGGVRLERSLPFDGTFPAYGTRSGVLPDPDPRVVTSSPLMWAEALDTILGEVARALGPDLSRVAAISGSGQQHGSVYLAAGAADRFASLDPGRPLAGQLQGVFARERAPVWMDASTGAQCTAITEAVGGADVLAAHTGSRAFERFTGPQIRKVREAEPDAYARTDRVHLVSSYLSSLLLGAHAPIDHGDGAGMNLMDLRSGDWWPPALEATAPELRRRLPALVPSDTVTGTLARYWRKRHGYPAARLVAWTGDNPSSLIGLGVTRPGVAAVSLGTSDTVFSLMREPAVDPHGTAHVFGAPTGDFMSLVCFRNGSLARERVRDAFGLDWAGFSAALRGTPAGNGGALMLPWFEPEITPPVSGGAPVTERLDPEDAAANVRACVEGQMLSMRRHSAWAAPRVAEIRATGGAARNPEILQVMADVFDAPVARVDVANTACLGAALRAAHAERRARGQTASWDEPPTGPWTRAAEVRPTRGVESTYAALAERHRALEERATASARDVSAPER